MSKEESTKHREALNVLELHLGSDYYKTGEFHNNILNAMQEYSDQQSKELRYKANIQKCKITKVGYLDKDGNLSGFIFDGQGKEGTVGIHYSSTGENLYGGYTESELVDIIEIRYKAIQQCQDKIDDTSAEMCENISDFRELIHEELEKLKG